MRDDWDYGDFCRWYRQHVRPQVQARVRARHQRRLDAYHEHLETLRSLLDCYGIEVRVLDEGRHVQFRLGEYIANYYPATRRFFFQHPQLVPTVTVPPHRVALAFLQQAKGIASEPSVLFSAPWDFVGATVPAEVLHVGNEVMPGLRHAFVDLAAYRQSLVERVSPREFEHLVAELLRRDGFEATVTPATGDRGRDIIAIRKPETPDTQAYVMLVECKRWLEGAVGIDIVQRLVGVRHIDRADHSMIVTTARFSQPARDEAQRVTEELSLVDGAGLSAWLARYRSTRERHGA